LNSGKLYSLDELDDVAKALLEQAKVVKTIAFSGDLGAGKTTIISALLKQLGVDGFSGSPTFSLINEYITSNNEVIYHFDFYRIKDPNEAMDIGWDEYLENENAWIFIEWPERIEDILPEHFLFVKIEHNERGRVYNSKMF
jgi:tRNA threonylcarbamoyladenosine biosynthesis protein TsaE